MKFFTEAQVKQLRVAGFSDHVIHGIDLIFWDATKEEPAEQPDKEVRTIRNGHQVDKDTKVWWRAADGPQQVTGNNGTHWENMRQFPEMYQLHEPKWTYSYED